MNINDLKNIVRKNAELKAKIKKEQKDYELVEGATKFDVYKMISIKIGLYCFLAFEVLFLPKAGKTEIPTEYQEDLIEYDQNLAEYAKYINSLNLSEMETIMKVMDDEWKDIKGYGEPSIDPLGFQRLVFKDENGVGVCRNLADDMTAKLNAINPDFEATNVYIYASLDEPMRMADINRVDLSHHDNSGNEKQEKNKLAKFHEFFWGNHMVTLVKIKSDNAILIIDPTNPSINVLDDSQIRMLSDNEKANYNVRLITSSLFNYSFEVLGKDLNSYVSNDDMDYLEKTYGIDAQNKILNELNEKNYEGMQRVKK